MSKSSDTAALKAVYDYLLKQNRPYSAIDIFNNLHKAHGKTLIVKVLDTLVGQKKIKSKIYGKQTVFVVDQSALPVVSDSELKALDVNISQQQAKLQGCTDSYKKLDTELRSLNNSITTVEAKERLELVTAQCEKMQTKLHHLKNNPNSISPEERAKIMSERAILVKQWRKRKRMANDMLSTILEGYPKSKKELYEDIGIEVDEEFNVKPPEL